MFLVAALHDHDPVFKKVSCSDKMSGILHSLGYKRPVIIQSMYIFKVLLHNNIFYVFVDMIIWTFLKKLAFCFVFQQPGIGGEVVPHQDNSFLYTDPPTCTGLWLALEDATTVNGCLWAIPGSHKGRFFFIFISCGIVCNTHLFLYFHKPDGLVRRFIRDDNGVHFDKPSPSYDQKDFVPVEVKAGSLVLIHGDLIHQRSIFIHPIYLIIRINITFYLFLLFNHKFDIDLLGRSFENQSSKSRHAYSLHVVDTHGCKWAADNWLVYEYNCFLFVCLFFLFPFYL